MSRRKNEMPGSISVNPENLEEFFCVKCKEVYEGSLAWTCDHGEAFDCCFICAVAYFDDDCSKFNHQRLEWEEVDSD